MDGLGGGRKNALDQMRDEARRRAQIGACRRVRGEALERLTKRMPLPEVKFLSIVVAIQQQAGGNLSEALSNLSTVLRDRFRLKMKVKALSAEAKASAMVLASLPPMVMFMLYLSATDYIAALFDTRTGNFALLACLIWMLMGVLVMRKMVNFKF